MFSFCVVSFGMDAMFEGGRGMFFWGGCIAFLGGIMFLGGGACFWALFSHCGKEIIVVFSIGPGSVLERYFVLALQEEWYSPLKYGNVESPLYQIRFSKDT